MSGDIYHRDGTKARQRKKVEIQCPHCKLKWEVPDNEDRSLPFRDALRGWGISATDLDEVVCAPDPKLVFEITRTDNLLKRREGYLASVDERRTRGTRGNNNDTQVLELARRLGNIPSRLIVFQKDVLANPNSELYVRSLSGRMWDTWSARQFFNTIRKDYLRLPALNEPDYACLGTYSDDDDFTRLLDENDDLREKLQIERKENMKLRYRLAGGVPKPRRPRTYKRSFNGKEQTLFAFA